jgi:hypothetical protein
MTSEIKVDTISEQTSANGVTIDGLTIKDGNIIGDVALAGTTPTFTIGDGGAEDASLIFDGNAQNFHIGLDDSEDKLTIGLGNNLGTTPAITIDENTNIVIPDSSLTIAGTGNYALLTLKSTDNDTLEGPFLNFVRDPSDVANGDLDGTIKFTADNNAGEAIVYNELQSSLGNVADGSEGGRLTLYQIIAGTTRNIMDISQGNVIFNQDSIDGDFRVESNGNANMLFVDGGNNRVGIGTASPNRTFTVSGDGIIGLEGSSNAIAFTESSSLKAYIASQSFGDHNGDGLGIVTSGTEPIKFYTNGSEEMRIEDDGTVYVGTTSSDVGGNTSGILLGNDGYAAFRRSGATVMYINRFTDDGVLINLYGQGSIEGTISVSGSTVSYNAFTGGHWSRLADNSKPTILRGTIMESIDEMCDWYQAVAEVAESTDDEGNVTPAHTVKEPIALGDKSVGDAITFTSNGTEYTGTIVKEDDVKHTKSKVSDTADSKKVYGVFSNWDDADDGLDGDVNDMNIAQVGTFIVRVNADEVVEAGDLLVSNGDGTAKVQDDDIIRSKTVAKVNSNIKVETYSDGSYTVPCTLHC